MTTIPFRKIGVFGVVMLWVSVAAAQNDCPTIVQNALNATDAACVGTSRNQACYGNILLQAEPQEGIAAFQFESPGDKADVVGIRTLTLQPLDAVEDIWGVALMQLQANLPETLPGQNVTFLLFGDVEITNAVESNVEPITLEVTSTGNINVRSGPSTNDGRISELADGEIVVADGRNPDSTWLRIQLPDGTPGWVSADLVTFEGDVSLLNVVDPLALPLPPLTPMQAFYFKSGIGDAPCEEAPDSGILIQTPEGAGQISLTVNEVDIQLGSTAYLQAQAGGEMAVNVVENQATVTADGTTRSVPAGSRVRVPLDANLAADGPPSEPEPYNNADLAALPVGHMPRAVTVAPALTQAELDALVVNTVPITGTWRFSVTAGEWGEGCPGSSEYTLGTGQWVLDGTTSFYGFAPSEFTSPEPGFFVADRTSGEAAHLELRILSPTALEGKRISYVNGLVCSTFEFTMEAVSDG
jgi:hypothetical protein